MKQWHLYLLFGLGVLCLIGLFFSVQDQKIRLGKEYIVGKNFCQSEKVCVKPLLISDDRTSARLVVQNFDKNQTCVQHIIDGSLVPLDYFDCQKGIIDINKYEKTKINVGVI